MVSIEERTAHGAAVLDEQYPGWADQIDLSRFRMSWGGFNPHNPESCGCVLAQLDSEGKHAGDFLLMLEQLTPTRDPVEQDRWAQAHGFASFKDEYEDLTREWSRLIQTRTAQAS